MNNSQQYVRRKNRRKVIRSIVQAIIIVVVGYMIVNALTSLNKYKEPDKSSWNNDQQFIAISYFGVARSSTSDHVSKKELSAQLKALADHGYVTISQQDVIDFYTKGSPLPEKALFLAFEDGRNDSALFTNNLLEKYNYKATMLTYANKMGSKQGKFLQPKQLRAMTKSGYWELGTNGYRLTYINILDQNNQYFEQLTQEQFYEKNKAQYYTHYLMDYIRDINNIPVEDRTQMEARIQLDYDMMNQIYSDTLGEVPRTYMIMHADTLYNGMEQLVENVNDKNIRSSFELHYNREGNMLNTSDMDRYDLTRVQPAPYWRTNHLIMKLGLDTNDSVTYVIGDEEEAKRWDISGGVVQFAPEEIVLTTSPGERALMNVKELELSAPFSLELTIGGHSSGIQTVQLGHSVDKKVSLQLRVQDKDVIVEQIRKLEDTEEVERLLAVKGKSKELEDIHIALKVIDQQISLQVNDKSVMTEESLDAAITKWQLQLTAQSKMEDNRWEDEGDYIYDGVFKDVKLTQLNDAGDAETLLYSNELKGWHKLSFAIKRLYHNVIDWAIETF